MPYKNPEKQKEFMRKYITNYQRKYRKANVLFPAAEGMAEEIYNKVLTENIPYFRTVLTESLKEMSALPEWSQLTEEEQQKLTERVQDEMKQFLKAYLTNKKHEIDQKVDQIFIDVSNRLMKEVGAFDVKRLFNGELKI